MCSLCCWRRRALPTAGPATEVQRTTAQAEARRTTWTLPSEHPSLAPFQLPVTEHHVDTLTVRNVLAAARVAGKIHCVDAQALLHQDRGRAALVEVTTHRA
jgi:hypothetical protein